MKGKKESDELQCESSVEKISEYYRGLTSELGAVVEVFRDVSRRFTRNNYVSIQCGEFRKFRV